MSGKQNPRAVSPISSINDMNVLRHHGRNPLSVLISLRLPRSCTCLHSKSCFFQFLHHQTARSSEVMGEEAGEVLFNVKLLPFFTLQHLVRLHHLGFSYQLRNRVDLSPVTADTKAGACARVCVCGVWWMLGGRGGGGNRVAGWKHSLDPPAGTQRRQQTAQLHSAGHILQNKPSAPDGMRKTTLVISFYCRPPAQHSTT